MSVVKTHESRACEASYEMDEKVNKSNETASTGLDLRRAYGCRNVSLPYFGICQSGSWTSHSRLDRVMLAAGRRSTLSYRPVAKKTMCFDPRRFPCATYHRVWIAVTYRMDFMRGRVETAGIERADWHRSISQGGRRVILVYILRPMPTHMGRRFGRPDAVAAGGYCQRRLSSIPSGATRNSFRRCLRAGM
jgi:hypothetical protein